MAAIFSQQRVSASPAPPPAPTPPPPAPVFRNLSISAGASSGTVGGSSIDGPTITAPSENTDTVTWSVSATPDGLVATPSSGTLSPGQAVTPTLNSITAAIYAITVANNSGGNVTGTAGNVQFYNPAPPAPAPSPATNWSTSSSNPGTLVDNVWTPGRDSNGVVTQASVNLLPLNQMVRVNGTSLQSLKTLLESTGYNFAIHDFSSGKDIRQAFVSWVGMAENGYQLAAYAGGGHADSSLTGIFTFNAVKMNWEITDEPSRPDTPGFEWSLNYRCPPNGTYTNYTTTGEYAADVDGIYQDMLPDGRPTSRHTYCGTVWDTTRNQIIESRVSKWIYDVETGTHTRQRWSVNGGPPKALTINHVLHYHQPTDSIWGLWSEADGGSLTFGQCQLPGSNIVSRAGCPNLGAGRGTHCSARLDENRAIYFWFSSSTVERWGIHNMLTNTWEEGSGNVVTNSQTLGGFVFDHEMQPAVHMPTWGASGQIIRRGTYNSIRGVWWLFDIATKTNNLSWTPSGIAMPTFVTNPGNKYISLDNLGIALFLDDTSTLSQTSWYVMRYR